MAPQDKVSQEQSPSPSGPPDLPIKPLGEEDKVPGPGPGPGPDPIPLPQVIPEVPSGPSGPTPGPAPRVRPLTEVQRQTALSELSSQIKAGTLKDCASIYTRGIELARGGVAIVYEAGSKTPKRGANPEFCWDEACTEAVVKEVKNGSVQNDSYFAQLAQTLNIAPKVYLSGVCRKGAHRYAFKIEERLLPATLEFVEAHRGEFGKQVKEMLKRMHDRGFVHGDIHLGNVLYRDGTPPKFYFADYDKALDLRKLDPAIKKEHIDYENMVAFDMIGGNYYPPSGWPIHLGGQQVDHNYKPWHTLLYKWKKADRNLDGFMSDDETEALSDRLGSATLARTAQEFYNKRVKDLDPNVRKGFLADADLDGQVSPEEQREASLDAWSLGPREYLAYTSDLKAKHSAVVGTGKNRIVSKEFPYNLVPLRADQILIISGGDRNYARRYTAVTAEQTKKFAERHGYRFEVFAGNLAAPRVPYWSKIFMLLDKMEQPANRVIVWFDDDGVVSVESDMIEQYLIAYPNRQVIVATDPEEYAYLNTGAMIVRNSKEGRDLMLEMTRVGEERRNVGWGGGYRVSTLMESKQDHLCLHEQQALQELILATKVIGPGWEDREVRKVRKNWGSYVQVVPQIDKSSGRNMNLFTTGNDLGSLKGRTRLDNNVKEQYDLATEPFFVQCAGVVDKNVCVDRALQAFNSGRRWW